MCMAAGDAEAKVFSAPTGEKPRRLAMEISALEVFVPESVECSKGQEEEEEGGCETATTDIGSSSESDSFLSSTEAEHAESLSNRGPLGLRRRTAPRSCGHFGGTLLESIPSTPVASDVCGQSPPAPTSEHEPTRQDSTDTLQLDATDESDTETSGPLLQPFANGLTDDIPALPPPRSPKRRPRPEALTITESNEPAVTAFAVGPFGTVPAAPAVRSPKRRTRAAAPAESHEDAMPAVTAVALGPFGTVPTLPAPRSPKRRTRAAAAASQNVAMPTVTAVRCSSFGTLPATKKRSRPANATSSITDETSVTSVQDGLYSTIPKVAGVPMVLPSPKKRAREIREAATTKVKREASPLKVWLSESVSESINGLDPMMPAKKRPVYCELFGSGLASALRCLEPGMPAKKRVPKFFLEEPFMVTLTPPGVADAAR